MKINITFLRFILGAFLIFEANSIYAIDALWEKSVSFVKRTDLMIPGKLIMDQQVVNGKGKIESESETVIEIPQTNGVLHAEVLKFIEDGVDKTVKNKEALETELDKEFKDLKHEMPYHLENPSNAITGIHSVSKSIDGINCVGYDFEVCEDVGEDKEPYCFKGTVWLNPETAIPVQIESIMQGLPRKEDGAEILSLNQTINFSCENGIWKRISEKQELWINARILFKKIVAVVTTHSEYKNHWRVTQTK